MSSQNPLTLRLQVKRDHARDVGVAAVPVADEHLALDRARGHGA